MKLQDDNSIEYVIISDTEDRVIKFGLSIPEFYKDNYSKEDDPWWKVHVIVKKPGIEINRSNEAMTHYELQDLADKIDERSDTSINEMHIDFMEPYYGFIVSRSYGELIVHIRDADSVTLWLEESDLENISSYIRRKLNDAMSI
ncbi:MAG: hypothetical protein MJ100_06890 [Ruminococcus sp.]|nr:hypothetical protein [Ruminococcus sp.]